MRGTFSCLPFLAFIGGALGQGATIKYICSLLVVERKRKSLKQLGLRQPVHTYGENVSMLCIC